MTVQQLIQKLQTLSPDALVLLSKDGEGNDYREAYDAYGGYYFDTLIGEPWHPDDQPELVPQDTDKPAIIIWPDY